MSVKLEDTSTIEHEPPSLRLNTLQNTRRSLARLVRMRARAEIEDADYKSLVYGISHLAQFFKLETEQEYAKRLEAVEDALKRQGKL